MSTKCTGKRKVVYFISCIFSIMFNSLCKQNTGLIENENLIVFLLFRLDKDYCCAWNLWETIREKCTFEDCVNYIFLIFFLEIRTTGYYMNEINPDVIPRWRQLRVSVCHDVEDIFSWNFY